MIEAKNLVRRYGDFAAVDDVSFSIAAGEVVGLLGRRALTDQDRQVTVTRGFFGLGATDKYR